MTAERRPSPMPEHESETSPPQKPRLVLAEGRDLRTEGGMLAFFRKLTGRKPTEAEIAELRAEMAQNPIPD
jgi:hypothetical protein